MSKNDVEMIKRIYASFNARDIDAVLAVLSDDVAWANGMEGGHINGREAVRDYWTRQWAVISPHVEPVAFEETPDGAVAVEVIQSVFDLDGRPLENQSHGLKDKTVTHVFRMQGDKIVRFDIRDAFGSGAV
ncbi:nuclear transport factor 2 family protein [Rhizobium leguminosarum]|uniref:nuclear transport factor 2 family protein n=1 Tax=Rhizobium TaxID=379 RepID=UPI001C96E938|nr:nuclear transport factor 2 family protein [Rhizobium leguminosarum]MBW8791142.1 nuclear transport factor 2 family protein [Rhizobium leguminosarum]MBY5447718.1 nuclear transport factor 2 family protein [Rhizobium leguminosarum]UWM75819.1 nuclear transport factor 2 family protein [Rhizobium leguminosarum bv. viciae]